MGVSIEESTDKVTMHDAGRVYIFKTALENGMRRRAREWERDAHQYLVEEILDKLLLERSGGEKTVEIRSEEFSDKVARWRCEE